MTTYTCAYSVDATNVSTATLSAAMATVDLDDGQLYETLGITVASDTMTTVGDTVTRTIVFNSDPGPLGDPGTKDALTNVFTEVLSLALATRVTAAPVVVM